MPRRRLAWSLMALIAARQGPDFACPGVVDNTDVYAFVSPGRPDQVTLIASFTHSPKRDAGSGMPEPADISDVGDFGDDVLYEIHVSNRPGARADVTYQFSFHTKVRNDQVPLGNAETITSFAEASWNRPQYYAVSRLERGRSPVLLRAGLSVVPSSAGPRGAASDRQFAKSATHSLPGDCQVFAGQRAGGVHPGLGAIFDLGTPGPLEGAQLAHLEAAFELSGSRRTNVHSIAIQVPISDLTRSHRAPTQVMHGDSVIGIWASASQQRSRIFDSHSERARGHGPFVQVCRSGNPLFRELLLPRGDHHRWNAGPPRGDDDFARHVSGPELARLLCLRYGGDFPNLAAYLKPRADLVALLLTGLPTGVIPGFQNFTGSKQADMLRLNLAVPSSGQPHELGLLAGDQAGFPNGRRVDDDVVTVQLRAIAGLTIPLVDSTFTPDVATAGVATGRPSPAQAGRADSSSSKGYFPYLGPPVRDSQTQPLLHAHSHAGAGQVGAGQASAGRTSRRVRQATIRQSRTVSALPAPR